MSPASFEYLRASTSTLDLDPPEDGMYGQVLDHSHEVGPFSPRTGCVSEPTEDLETGKYIWFEFEHSLEPFDWETRRPLHG